MNLCKLGHAQGSLSRERTDARVGGHSFLAVGLGRVFPLSGWAVGWLAAGVCEAGCEGFEWLSGTAADDHAAGPFTIGLHAEPVVKQRIGVQLYHRCKRGNAFKVPRKGKSQNALQMAGRWLSRRDYVQRWCCIIQLQGLVFQGSVTQWCRHCCERTF